MFWKTNGKFKTTRNCEESASFCYKRVFFFWCNMRFSHKLQALYARGNTAITVEAVQGRMVIVNLEWLCAIFCLITLCHFYHLNINSEKGGGEGVTVKIHRDSLTMCRWIGSHFHGSIDFYSVAFSAIFNRVTHFWDFRRKKIIVSKDS